MGRNGSEWFIVEYPTSIYINTNINMKHDQTKKQNSIKSTMNRIALNINKIKNMFNNQNSLPINQNINRSGANKNKIDLNIKETESNKRNKFGFPTFLK